MTPRKILYGILFLLMNLGLVACAGPGFELPCFDLPGTEASCDSGENPEQTPEIKIDWICDECVSIRQGFAPLVVSFWLDGIDHNPESPILWEIQALNSQEIEKEFTKSNERLSYTFENEDVYAITASYGDLELQPIEIRVDVNEVEANWSSPWVQGELCDARIHLLADPEQEKQVPYFVEVIVNKSGLEAIKIRDWVPYRLKFPEHVHGHRITPVKSPKPYRFPAQIEPQVILFDGAGPLNQVWDVDVQCLHANRYEELKIIYRL